MTNSVNIGIEDFMRKITLPKRYFDGDFIINELFHVPFSKRQNVSNSRFSLAEFPSLYLSTMLPLAWQETGYPTKYYYSEYQYEYGYDSLLENRDLSKELQFISLYSPNEINFWGTSVKYNDFDLWLTVIARYLKTYPLTLACSFVNSSGDTPYKQEYIIQQMLMQWIQRNYDFAQGITYFTCIETSAVTEGWCAYNIALPALSPDEQGYSQKLQESFRWSKPIPYSMPIADRKTNASDRKILNEFISDVTSILRTKSLPDKLVKSLREMLEVSSYLDNLLESANTTDMELVLHMLSSIRSNYYHIRENGNRELIEQAKTGRCNLSPSYSEEAYELFLKVYDRFVERSNDTGAVGKLIDKYYCYTWNDLAPESHLLIYTTRPSDCNELTEWLKSNHILYYYYKLTNNDESVTELRNIANSQGKTVGYFFDKLVDNDEWIKDNITSIKQPILVKQNNISILSPKSTQKVEFVQMGFDKDDPANLLNANSPQIEM
jgi:hypothetical protein